MIINKKLIKKYLGIHTLSTTYKDKNHVDPYHIMATWLVIILQQFETLCSISLRHLVGKHVAEIQRAAWKPSGRKSKQLVCLVKDLKRLKMMLNQPFYLEKKGCSSWGYLNSLQPPWSEHPSMFTQIANLKMLKEVSRSPQMASQNLQYGSVQSETEHD